MTQNLNSRHIGIWGLTAFYISSIVGVGILIVPGIAYQLAGPASLISWSLLILVSFPLAYLFARISMRYPNNGGIVYFIRLRFGSSLGHASGLLLTVTMIVGNPIMGIASARYLFYLLGISPEGGLLMITAFGFMLFSVLFNLLNIQLNSQIQLAMLLALLAGLLCIIIFAIPHYQFEAVVPFAPNGWASVGTAMVVCLYSFLGWENVSTIAEEVRNPAKTYKRAMVISVIVVGILYLALAASIVLAIPYQGSGTEKLAIAQLLMLISSPRMSILGNVFAILLMVLCTNAWVLSASRFITSLGRDGVLHSAFTKVFPKTNAPYFTLFFLQVTYGIVLLLLYLISGDEKQLMLFANGSFILVYLLAFLACYRHFQSKYVDVFTIISLLFCIASLYFIGRTAILPAFFAVVLAVYHWRRNSYAIKKL